MPSERLRSFVGLFILCFVSWLFCPRDLRRKIPWKCVVWGTVMQFALAIVILWSPFVNGFFGLCGDLVDGLLAHATEGARLVFGPLVNTDLLAKVFGPENSTIFSLQELGPVIIFFASLMAVGYQIGLMQWVVGLTARAVVKLLDTSGAETLSCVGNIFLGMVEAPLMIRPYLPKLTRSELYCVMVCGLSNVAGTVLAVYVGLLKHAIPDIAGHLITMSVMSAPAGLVISKLMLPETGEPETRGVVVVTHERAYTNVMDAMTGGASEGLNIALNVTAMLIAMVATVHFANAVLGTPAVYHNQHIVDRLAKADAALATIDVHNAPAVQAAADNLGLRAVAWQPPTFQHLSGYLFRPLAWCLGVPLRDVPKVGELLGEKTVLNEFVAYLDMAKQLDADPNALTERGRVLASYALCSFANFGSVAIMIGGIAALVPSRRKDLAELGLLSLVGGTIAACLTACAAGVFI
jgi:CNT family concentrative nucleoside transporter